MGDASSSASALVLLRIFQRTVTDGSPLFPGTWMVGLLRVVDVVDVVDGVAWLTSREAATGAWLAPSGLPFACWRSRPAKWSVGPSPITISGSPLKYNVRGATSGIDGVMAVP